MVLKPLPAFSDFRYYTPIINANEIKSVISIF